MAVRCLCFVAVSALFGALCSGEVCQKPQVTHQVYTTTDGLIVSNTAFIAEFTVSCGNGAKGVSLFADVKGDVVPAVKSPEGNNYQVSWTEELNKASSGEYLVRVYDEEGYAALRKAQRMGEDTKSVTPFFTLNINHAGSYLGPWVQSEFVAMVAAVLLWYFAYSAKCKLQS
ncbi:translocon-associated protein subunit delta-like [Ornithodoros turicata]|uniref:translocon-associated protein subunit delta-like n=1 Tax=Ornithodoros turicata TaxID=34597 RepID=UPI0031388EE4